MANPRKFSEKIALHNQKQAEETAAFEKIMREVSDATNKLNSSTRRAKSRPAPEQESTESTLRPAQTQGLGSFRSGSLPNVAAPEPATTEPDKEKPEEASLASQYGGAGGSSPQRVPGPRGRTSSSVGPMRNRPAERKHDTSPYGSTVYLSRDHAHNHVLDDEKAKQYMYSSSTLSPPPDSSWRRTNSDSALHQSCGEQPQTTQPLSPHHHLHHHHHGHHPHQNHRRTGDIQLDVLAALGANATSRPRSSCEIPRIPNNIGYNYRGYEVGGGGGGGGGVGGGGGAGGVGGGGGSGAGAGGGGGGLMCGELQVPGGSLPDLTSVHFPPPHGYGPLPHAHPHQHPLPHRTSPEHYRHHQSPTSPGAISPSGGAGSVSPATGGLSPASGSPVGATVPSMTPLDHALHATLRNEHPSLYDAQNHLSVPNTNNYLHHNKSMSPLDHSWMTSSYQSHCSPPSQYSSTSNINIPSPTMVHSPGSPVGSPQADYNNIHQTLLQPFEQITMMDSPVSNYNTSYMNHTSPHSPHSPQTTNTPHTYSQSSHRSSPVGGCGGGGGGDAGRGGGGGRECGEVRASRDPVPGGNGPVFPLTSPTTPTSIPNIILTDYSSELDAGIFGGEEAQLRAGLDLDDLSLLEEPSALLPDSSVEHEFRLDRL